MPYFKVVTREAEEVTWLVVADSLAEAEAKLNEVDTYRISDVCVEDQTLSIEAWNDVPEAYLPADLRPRCELPPAVREGLDQLVTEYQQATGIGPEAANWQVTLHYQRASDPLVTHHVNFLTETGARHAFEALGQRFTNCAHQIRFSGADGESWEWSLRTGALGADLRWVGQLTVRQLRARPPEGGM